MGFDLVLAAFMLIGLASYLLARQQNVRTYSLGQRLRTAVIMLVSLLFAGWVGLYLSWYTFQKYHAQGASLLVLLFSLAVLVYAALGWAAVKQLWSEWRLYRPKRLLKFLADE